MSRKIEYIIYKVGSLGSYGVVRLSTLLLLIIITIVNEEPHTCACGKRERSPKEYEPEKPRTTIKSTTM